MSRFIRILIGVSFAVAGLLLASGLWQMLSTDRDPDNSQYNKSVIRMLEDNWICMVNEKPEQTMVSLPMMLSPDEPTDTIMLINTVPEDIKPGEFLRFSAFLQVVHIYIGGELRMAYGDPDADAHDYPYSAAAHYMMIELEERDRQQELVITLTAPLRYQQELCQINAVEIGSRRDFILRNLTTDASSLVFTVISLLFSGILLFVSLISRKREFPSQLTFIFGVYTILWTVYYNSDNTFMWELADYNPRYSAFNDWRFYMLDMFLPIFSYYVVSRVMNIRLKRWQKMLIIFHISLFIFTGFCTIFRLLPLYQLCAWVKNMALLVYIGLIPGLRKQLRYSAHRLFIYAIWLLLFCYFSDYIRYNLSLIPVLAQFYPRLQLDFPFLFLLGIGLFVYCILLAIGIMELLNEEKDGYKKVLDRFAYRLRYSQMQYEETMARINALKIYRHDMIYHFRTMLAFTEEGRYEELQQYLIRMQNSMEEHRFRQWCSSTLCSSIIDWYCAEAQKYNITFTCEADIPEEQEAIRMDVCAVFSNVLQNALEACRQVRSGTPYIQVSARVMEGTLYLQVKNTYDGVINRSLSGNRLRSRKGAEHGIGLESIAAVVHKYNGVLQTAYDQKVFTIDIVLNNLYGAVSDSSPAESSASPVSSLSGARESS